MSFLIVYHRPTGTIWALREYVAGEERDAVRQRFALERQHLGDGDVEVVLLHADSLESVKRTHSRYFMGVSALLDLAACSVAA